MLLHFACSVTMEGANMKPAYFDFTVHDVGQARKFFEEIFGWQFERFPMPYEYYRIQAGPEGEPGIDGGIADLRVSIELLFEQPCAVDNEGELKRSATSR